MTQAAEGIAQTAPEQNQHEPYPRRFRVGVQLPITRTEYRQMQRRARKAGLRFAGWLRCLALEELTRPPRRLALEQSAKDGGQKAAA